MEVRHFEAAVTAAVLIDKEITRWEKGVAELEKLFFESYHEPGDGVVDYIPLPCLVPVVENVSDSVVEFAPT